MNDFMTIEEFTKALENNAAKAEWAADRLATNSRDRLARACANNARRDADEAWQAVRSLGGQTPRS